MGVCQKLSGLKMRLSHQLTSMYVPIYLTELSVGAEGHAPLGRSRAARTCFPSAHRRAESQNDLADRVLDGRVATEATAVRKDVGGHGSPLRASAEVQHSRSTTLLHTEPSMAARLARSGSHRVCSVRKGLHARAERSAGRLTSATALGRQPRACLRWTRSVARHELPWVRRSPVSSPGLGTSTESAKARAITPHSPTGSLQP